MRPGLTGVFGDVFGLPFSVEGIFFFLEAIFITIYIHGWKHLSPWAHFWSGAVLPFVAIGGVFSIVSANGSRLTLPRGSCWARTAARRTSIRLPRFSIQQLRTSFRICSRPRT